MTLSKRILSNLLKLLLFWLLVFQFERLLFSIHNWDKFDGIGFGEYLGAYFYSFRLDIASAAILSGVPLLFLLFATFFPQRLFRRLFVITLFAEVILVACIHAGEINAYTEWNHKLTSRVFTHLANPDEVVRTADWSMTIWFFLYAFLEVFFGWRMLRWLFRKVYGENRLHTVLRTILAVTTYAVTGLLFFIFARGGLQQIPINIDAAYYSQHYVSNDLSVNSFYFFSKSFLLYRRGDIDVYMPKIDPKQAEERTKELLACPQPNDAQILSNTRPNLVFIILESWSANAIGCLSEQEQTTPNFDRLAKEGLLFTNFYATGGTSEIGNASIFSGYPALPEISLSMQPDKHRKLPALNQDLEGWGYSTNYVFSGDLKYGNIGGFFTDHGFDVVLDEKDFPSGLPRGKLNFYDEDLYDFLIDRMNRTPQPFLHCAFTGSTHSPYDHPKKGFTKHSGEEGAFLNSVGYADQALADFLEKCKEQPWFENTLFVFVADHGHATPIELSSANSDYYRIPLLFWGPVLKESWRGKEVDQLGCQTDIPATLLKQMNGDLSRYPWSRDLLNASCHEFVLHTIQRGYGFVTPRGNMTYQMDTKRYIQNSLPDSDIEDCHRFLLTLYRNFKSL